MQILVVTKNLDFIKNGQLTKALQRYLNASDIVLVVPLDLYQTANKLAAGCSILRVFNEVEILGFPLSGITNWSVDNFPTRAGWYYQQFIKLGFARTSIAQERFLIWDADTIPTRKMSVFDGDKLIFTRGHEFHTPYFETNKMLIGVNRANDEKFSAISQHVPVERALMLELLQMLDASSADASWVTAIRKAIEHRQGMGLFSEYELFADYVRSRYPNRFVLRSLPWLRQGAMLSKIEIAIIKQFTWFISFEEWHKSDRKHPLNHLRCWKRFYLENYRTGRRLDKVNERAGSV